MIVSAEVSRCAAICESQTGKKASEGVLRIVEVTHQLGMRMEELGRKHAAENSTPVKESEMQKLTRDIEDMETETVINLYLFECYMAGYNAEKEELSHAD